MTISLVVKTIPKSQCMTKTQAEIARLNEPFIVKHEDPSIRTRKIHSAILSKLLITVNNYLSALITVKLIR